MIKLWACFLVYYIIDAYIYVYINSLLPESIHISHNTSIWHRLRKYFVFVILVLTVIDVILTKTDYNVNLMCSENKHVDVTSSIMKIIRLKNYIGQAIANQGDMTIDYWFLLQLKLPRHFIIITVTCRITRMINNNCIW